MFQKPLLNFILVIIFAIDIRDVNASCLGCVELDEVTFDKLIRKFEYSLVKFDIAFPYGDKHEAYSEFAKSVSLKVSELLIGAVGVKDYGEKENSALAERYKINEKEFPVIMLFQNYSTENWVQYPSTEEITPSNLKLFIKKHSKIYIGLDGCLEVMDILVDRFTTKSREDQDKTIEIAKEVSEKLDEKNDKEKSKIYLVIMKRIVEKGLNFVDEEKRRIENLQKSKISDSKRRELIYRLNILESFISNDNSEATKDEL